MNKTQDLKLQIATDLERERERVGFLAMGLERERVGFSAKVERERGSGFRSKRVGFWLRFREREKAGFSAMNLERELEFRPWI